MWAGLLWPKKVEMAAAVIFGVAFALNWLDFRILQVSAAALDEMREYIDQRIEEKKSEDIAL
jgi:hypothetical protein